MSRDDEIRQSVSETYARAVSAPATSGCGCAAPSADAGWASALGYTPEQIQAVAGDAAGKSFGCGNPLAFSQVRPGQVVLDLGSGAGLDLLIAADRVGPGGQVIGVDMTDEMIETARRNIAEAGLTNVEIRKGIIEELPVDDASVDWVISNCVINLSPDKPAVFREIARVLRPGGRMLVSDIVAEGLPEAMVRSQALYDSCISGAIPEADYLAGLRDAGLTEVEVRDRRIIDLATLTPLIDAATPGLDQLLSCCGTSPTREAIEALAPTLAGKIASIEVSATRK